MRVTSRPFQTLVLSGGREVSTAENKRSYGDCGEARFERHKNQ
jgi:hypothetical protein